MAYGRLVRTCFLAVLVAAVLTVGACGDDDDQEPATATRETTAGASSGAEAAEPLPRAPGPLTPGAYVTEVFEPTMSFSLGRGWRVLAPETPTFATLVHGGGGEPLLAFVRPVRVVDPERRYPRGVPESGLLPIPDDLAGWLARHPLLKAGERKTVTVGGVRGTQIDITVESPYRSAGCPAPCVLFFATSPEFMVQATEGQRIRATILEVDGEQIAIGILASDEGFEELAAPAEQVVETLRFR
jgi:hypothetical protein